MSEEEYITAMNRVVLAVRALAQEPIDDLLHVLEVADAFAPILAPTRYRDGGARNVAEQRRVLLAVARLRDVYRELVRSGEESAHG